MDRKVHNLLFCRLFFLVVCSFLCCSASAQSELLAKRILEAHQNHEPIPNISQETAIDIGGAYQVQAAVVRGCLSNDKIAGFKAGLTSQDAQAHFGINRPIFAVLFKSGNYSEHSALSLKKFHRLMIETELGYITKKPIKQTVNSIAELKTYIGQIVPVIELPEAGFAHQNITAPDLIAGIGYGGYILHNKINWMGQNVNFISVSLLHNGTIVNQGQGKDAMGDQWEALRWLVNQVLAHGWFIEEGNLLITGALGEIVPVEPGVYKAQYNDGATLEITFTA